jgi:hypothetical protein
MRRAWALVVVVAGLGCGPAQPPGGDELGESSDASDASSSGEAGSSSSETSSGSSSSETETEASATETSEGTSETGVSECPTQVGSITITDETDLDTLACLVEADWVEVSGSFADLAFLSTLERVDYLVIRNNPNLVDLGGLDSLQMVGQLWLSNSPSVVDLAGLPADVSIWLLSVGGDLSSLVSLAMPPNGARRLEFAFWQRADLELLMTASPTPTFIAVRDAPLLPDLDDIAQCCLAQQAELGLEISGTPLLTTLQGLEPFTTLASFKLYDNPEVESLAGLANLVQVGELRLDDYCFPLWGAKLANLQGLEQLVQVDTLAINAQAGLVSLDGLPSDLAVGLVEMGYNPMLDQALIDAWLASAMPNDAWGCDNLNGPGCEGICPQ